jgi:phage baseplate assembly protein W
MRDLAKLHGRGLRFPLVESPGFDWVAGADAVAQALRALLLTEPGERIGRPGFGVGLRRFLFMPNALATRTAIRDAVTQAIERDEARVELDEVRVLSDSAEATLLRVEVHYRLRREPTARTLVFPFYLDGGGA